MYLFQFACTVCCSVPQCLRWHEICADHFTHNLLPSLSEQISKVGLMVFDEVITEALWRSFFEPPFNTVACMVGRMYFMYAGRSVGV